MDIAAAAQLSGAQRQQQSALSGIKSAQVQAQSLISVLTAATSQAAQTQVAAQPVNSTGGTTDSASADRRLPRGSIVNILA
ncbi:MAG TPA: hypothetical protein VFE34_03555 [Dongiaceae bacterium]|jgi:hypothetical protein|nr:hypothetical protein [Dongiaceae bacterium]